MTRPPCRRRAVRRSPAAGRTSPSRTATSGSVSSGPTIPETNVGGEVAQVGVDEADDVAAGGQQRAPQHLALAGQRRAAAAGSSSRCTTLAPAAAATSAVRSVEPESITTSSSTSGTASVISSRRITATIVADRRLLVECGQHDADRRGPSAAWRPGAGPSGRSAADQERLLSQRSTSSSTVYAPPRWPSTGRPCDPSRGSDGYLNPPGLRLQS